jgi:NADP-dependent aldehyde dehydrogenase
MTLEPILIDGKWRQADSNGSFKAENPARRQATDAEYPISSWDDCSTALGAAANAAVDLAAVAPDRVAAFLDAYAQRIDARAEEICALAHRETALPIEPRLLKVELPRTSSQLRQAAAAAREGSWRLPTIDTAADIRSYYAAIGPVAVFGPNNFPLAFNGVAGGDFAAAIAAGNPVIAKANTSHPGTTRLLAHEAHQAVLETDLPPATVQMLYRISHADGEGLVRDPRVGAVAYTGSRPAGLKLKAAADDAGTPIYLELSSVNPVVLLPGAIASRSDEILDELVGSCLMGAGQFCTSPNLIVMQKGAATQKFIKALADRLAATPPGVLLSKGVHGALADAVNRLREAGAEVLVGGEDAQAEGYAFQNTLLHVSGEVFIGAAADLQTEAFGNATTVVVADNLDEMAEVLAAVEGSLTGCFYSDKKGADDEAYLALAPLLRRRVGRLLNDKMPTGVAVSPAMNHGGPFPATGHPGWTAVGIPASLRRFAMLQCFDNVRPKRLPPELADKNPHPQMWRFVDGAWQR